MWGYQIASILFLVLEEFQTSEHLLWFSKYPAALLQTIYCVRRTSGYSKCAHHTSSVYLTPVKSIEKLKGQVLRESHSSMMDINWAANLPKKVSEKACAELWAVTTGINLHWRCCGGTSEVCNCHPGYSFESAERLTAARCSAWYKWKG